MLYICESDEEYHFLFFIIKKKKKKNKIMEKKIVRGDIFIIPNMPTTLGEGALFAKMMCPKLESVGIKNTPDNEVLIQVWVTSPECDNWPDHHRSYNDMMGGTEDEMFPGYLPSSLFKDKKEGDIVSFENDTTRFELTCTQKNYRYRAFGNFEKVLSDLLNAYKAYDTIDV